MWLGSSPGSSSGSSGSLDWGNTLEVSEKYTVTMLPNLPFRGLSWDSDLMSSLGSGFGGEVTFS